MNILVTGGAGYIGSVVVENLIAKGYSVIVIDDLRDGKRSAVPQDTVFFKNDFGDEDVLEKIFHNYEIYTVMHFAASANVPLSVKMPSEFYHNNVIGSINLLNKMVKHNIKNIIFSSTAAVYGEPCYIPIDEIHPLNPINPYGNSKLMVENILADFAKAYGLKYVALRYFCAAGATEQNGESRKSKETHLIPLVVDKIIVPEKELFVFGNDYATRDGSGIRDYVHVRDIAAAHIAALESIDKRSNSVYNIGTNSGYSVLEVIKEAESIFKTCIEYSLSDRRHGDPANLTSTFDKINNELGWEPENSLRQMIVSTMNWRKNPKY
ncbi:MAG: UDP-glucose 4-epimerase GalE [Bacteroidetes bacterium]|nr:UDP-glucose 4-epimerase GalE [Bacteroidota bacterium]